MRDGDQKPVSPYLCPQDARPEALIRTCNDHPCPPRWNYSDFQPCTKSCGVGFQTREVNCIHEVTRGGTNTVIVPNNMCPQPPPIDRQYCNVLDCPIRWHTTEWTKVRTGIQRLAAHMRIFVFYSVCERDRLEPYNRPQPPLHTVSSHNSQ